MAPTSKIAGAFAGLVAVTLALSACSAPAEDNASAELETLTIGTSGTFRPITYSEGGELTGFDIAVGTEVADRIGMKAEFVEGQLAGLIPGLDSGQFDALMSGLTQTEARLESVSFSVAYHAEGTIAVVASGSDITDVTDLAGLRVGAISGSGSEGDVEEIGGYESYVGYPGTPEGIADLIAGRIDVFATGRVAAEAYISTAGDGDQIELAGETYHLLPVGIALPKEGSEELMAKIDGALEEMTSDGTLEDLQEEWLGFVPTIPES